MYPLSWLAEGWIAWALGGKLALVVFPSALLPTGFFALAWHERLDRACRKAARSVDFYATATCPTGCADSARRSRPSSRSWSDSRPNRRSPREPQFKLTASGLEADGGDGAR